MSHILSLHWTGDTAGMALYSIQPISPLQNHWVGYSKYNTTFKYSVQHYPGSLTVNNRRRRSLKQVEHDSLQYGMNRLYSIRDFPTSSIQLSSNCPERVNDEQSEDFPQSEWKGKQGKFLSI